MDRGLYRSTLKKQKIIQRNLQPVYKVVDTTTEAACFPEDIMVTRYFVREIYKIKILRTLSSTLALLGILQSRTLQFLYPTLNIIIILVQRSLGPAAIT